MNFRGHQNKLIENIGIALKKDKDGLINDFIAILSSAKKLYKTERYDFWRSQLGRIQRDEIPITNYGFKSARALYRCFKNADRNGVASILVDMCECLFTYSNENELCEMQSDYHYYFDIKKSMVFKISELGIIQPKIEMPSECEYRIALKSEVGAKDDEFI